MLLTGYIDSVDQHLHTITKSVMNINNEFFLMFQTGCFLSKVGNFNFGEKIVISSKFILKINLSKSVKMFRFSISNLISFIDPLFFYLYF